MPFGIDLSDVFDFATDFIPGGDWIDDLVLGDGENGGNGGLVFSPTPGDVVTGNGRTPSPSGQHVPGAHLDASGCPVSSYPLQSKTIAACGRGYVAVDSNGDGVNDTCMLKEVARKCRLWAPRTRPFLTGGQMKTIRKAARLMDKTDRLVTDINKVRGKAKLVRQSRSR